MLFLRPSLIVCAANVLPYFLLFCLSYSRVASEPSNVGTRANLDRSHINAVLNNSNSLQSSPDHGLEESEEKNLAQPLKPSTVHGNAIESTTQLNITAKPDYPGIGKAPKLNSAALLRGFYVFAGLGVMVAMYILVRAIRLRRRKTTVRKYGLLGSREDLEMTLLDDEEDEEEDTTLFDVKKQCTT